MRIAVLASHEGTTLQALIDACESGELDASVVLVISNNSKSGALRRAHLHGINALHISSKDYPDECDLDWVIWEALYNNNVDYVLLAGYMKKIGSEVLFQYEGSIFNTHPSLLPKYGGEAFYGRRIHEEVYRNREKETGVTFHHVDGGYDTGEIISQVIVPIDYEIDTVETVEEKVKTAEKRLIIDTFKHINGG